MDELSHGPWVAATPHSREQENIRFEVVFIVSAAGQIDRILYESPFGTASGAAFDRQRCLLPRETIGRLPLGWLLVHDVI